jgi:hypothetical protein
MNHIGARLMVSLASWLWQAPLVHIGDGTRMRKSRTGSRRRPKNWFARRKARMQMARDSRRGNR